jgi:hypothetical protein
MTELSDVKTDVALLKQDMVNVKAELKTHSDIQTTFLETMEGIRMEMSEAKGFLKALVVCAGICMVLITAAYTINWLRIPTVIDIQAPPAITQPYNK